MQWRKNALCNEFGRDSNALVKDAFLEGNIHGHVISEILSFLSPESLLTRVEMDEARFVFLLREIRVERA